jgi:hypothetical protein
MQIDGVLRPGTPRHQGKAAQTGGAKQPSPAHHRMQVSTNVQALAPSLRHSGADLDDGP